MLFRDGKAESTAVGAHPKGSLEKMLGLSEG
jgi:hypothetical protein